MHIRDNKGVPITVIQLVLGESEVSLIEHTLGKQPKYYHAVGIVINLGLGYAKCISKRSSCEREYMRTPALMFHVYRRDQIKYSYDE